MKRYDKRYDDIAMEEHPDGEWVPAEVAQGLYDALNIFASLSMGDAQSLKKARTALAAADGEE